MFSHSRIGIDVQCSQCSTLINCHWYRGTRSRWFDHGVKKRSSVVKNSEIGAMGANDRKKRKTDVQNEDDEEKPLPNLERRAAHFARADPKSLPSSTPTGSLTSKRGGDQKESWPGPFATAHAMIQQREDAKKAREEAILAAANGTVSAATNLADMDEFDRFLHTVKWDPSSESRGGMKRHTISSLSDICVKTLVCHFPEIDDSTLGVLSTEICSKFAVELCRQRLFTSEVAMQLAITGSEGIFFPECSNLSDDTLVAAMEKVSRNQCQQGDRLDESSDSATLTLRLLQLRNCGHGFTDQVAVTVSEKHAPGLEILEITGCYRLNEAALCSLLLQCRLNLKSLDLSCNSRLGVNSLTTISTMANLTSLKLDHATPLTNDMIAPLAADGTTLSALENLSFAGLIDLTDDGFGPIVKRFGPQLRQLCVRGCIQLTDASIMLMREECSVLDILDIGGLGDVTTAALLGLFIEGPVLRGDVIVEIPILFDTSMDLEEDKARKSVASHTNDDDDDDENMPGMSSTAVAADDVSSSSIGRLSKICLAGLPSSVTDDVVIQLCQLSSNLTSVDLGGCSQLTGRSITALQLLCRELEALDISFIRTFTEDSLGSLVDNCPELKKLSIWGCTQLTKRFFDGHRNDSLIIEGRMEA